ncbi:uncharacterized protein LOC129745409 [Uranotaenia lowii]|uniref:uncharacterized protein LOC129745409 n=1 Tax=Uranotaenia lowii TaxID=190385 RepID=UPI0024788619|nr:uncharacterized protein LOC129745409 [Uranotaenia lowii]
MRFRVFFYILTLALTVSTVNAAPLLGLGNVIGGGTGSGGGLLNKVQEFGERVYEKKRDFLNGINEKVSNILWIPPLPTKVSREEVEHFNLPAAQDHDRLIFSDTGSDEGYTEPNLEIYARSSFLSPEDLEDRNGPQQTRPNVSVNVKNSFSLFGKA